MVLRSFHIRCHLCASHEIGSDSFLTSHPAAACVVEADMVQSLMSAFLSGEYLTCAWPGDLPCFAQKGILSLSSTVLQTQLMPSWLQQEGLLQSHASAPDKNTKCF